MEMACDMHEERAGGVHMKKPCALALFGCCSAAVSASSQ
jgi:hypothetical protein